MYTTCLHNWFCEWQRQQCCLKYIYKKKKTILWLFSREWKSVRSINKLSVVCLKDIPLPSPVSSVSTVPSILGAPTSLADLPTVVNVTNETEINLAQSSYNVTSMIPHAITLSKCRIECLVSACYFLFTCRWGRHMIIVGKGYMYMQGLKTIWISQSKYCLPELEKKNP